MSELRDRIANAIRRAAYQHSYVPGPYLAGLYADSVIAELKLTESDNFTYEGRSAEKLGLTDDVEPWHGQATHDDTVDVTWVPQGTIDKWLGRAD